MKKFGKLMLSTLCVAMLMTAQLNAAGTTLEGTSTQDGDTVEVTVSINDANAYSGEIALSYDADAIEVVEATAGKTLENSITSINASEEGVIIIGFASLEEITAGEILDVEFEIVGDVPEEGLKFEITANELSGEELNDEKEKLEEGEYEFVVEVETDDETDIGAGDDKDDKEEGEDLDTGDDTNIIPYIVLIVGAVVVGAAVVIIRKKKEVANN